MKQYQDIFNIIDSFDSIEELKEYEKTYDENHIAELFWQFSEIALESDDKFEKEKASAKCRFLYKEIGCYVPVSSKIKKFKSPYGLKGIFISSQADIGENCTIFPNVVIGSNTILDSRNAGFPQIGNNVFIGANSTIIGGVKVGNNVRIDANSVVVDDVPDNTLVVSEKGKMIQKEIINNQFLTPVQFKRKNPKAADGGRSIISPFSSSEYIKNNILESDGPGTVFETCKLLDYSLPEITDNPQEYLNLDVMYDNPEDMISLFIKKIGLNVSEKDLLSKYIKFKNYFCQQQCFESVNKTNCVVWFWDWILFSLDHGYSHNDYFDFEFYKKSVTERNKFIGQGYRRSINRISNTQIKSYRENLLNKVKFNKMFSKYIYREWLDSTSCSLQEFKDFLSRHDCFFAKPINGTGGYNTSKIISGSDTPENLFKLCKENEMIVEEVVKQHKEMAKFNESTVNTIRLYTILDTNDNAHITMGCIRFGRTGKVADNFHQGGCGVVVNLETGVVCTDAIDRTHNFNTNHPDSGVTFKGWQCPIWETIVECVKEAAKMIPRMKHVGWDIAVNEDGKVEFIEGNGFSNIDLPQASDQVGKKYIYEPILKELAAKQDINFPESEIWFR